MKTIVRFVIAGLLAMSSGALAGGDPSAGKQKSQVCISCHGEDGNSEVPQTPQAPRLAGQHADYLVKALEDYASGARQNPVMAAFAANLNDKDREDLAAYYARQVGLRVIGRTD